MAQAREVHQIIHLHPQAPAKPDVGAACNGCGVCCAVAPCPIGVVVSRRTSGACDALVWNDDSRAYRCGLIAQPHAHLPRVLRWLAPMLAKLAYRSVSAGVGCDCDWRPEPSA